MKIRWKLLSFLAVIITGAFLIISWKTQDLYSQKYALLSFQKETQSLEQLSWMVSDRLQGLERALQKGKKVKSVLAYYDVKMLAHVVRESGKWKARWNAGERGFRSQAKAVMKQIPFSSLPAQRKTWHEIMFKNNQQGFAYVIPRKSESSSAYSIFFIDKKFFQNVFSHQVFQGDYTLFSPFLGQIFSTNSNMQLETLIGQQKKQITSSQQGYLNLSEERSAIYLFNPDLQLYLFKTAPTPYFKLGSVDSLVLLFLIAAVLLCITLVAVDFFMRGIFERLERLTDALVAVGTDEQKAISVSSADEISSVEMAYNMLVESDGEEPMIIKKPALETATIEDQEKAEEETTDLIEEIRPKAINTIGHLHKMKEHKEDSPAPYIKSMETELREMRRLMDKAEAKGQRDVFSPKITDTQDDKETAFTVRKPRRESDEQTGL